jgi:lysophospholipase L1-like esterase
MLILLLLMQDVPFELQEGDRVVLLGNTFVEREAAYGRIEAALVRRFPKATFRNLAWSGDRADVQLRPNGFPSLESRLEELKPSVLIVSFGTMEAFDGESGRPKFVRAYGAFLDRLATLKARVVLLSPTPHEEKGPPFADPAEHNRDLARYAEAIRTLARERGARYVDLLGPLSKAKGPLTENGIHLTSEGYAVAARAIEDGLGLPPALHRIPDLAAGRHTLFAGGNPVATATAEEWARGVELPPSEELRRTIVEKNLHYFIRWRPQNAEYIYGTRSKAEGANVGNPQFESEFRKIEGIVAEYEARIAGLARPRYEVRKAE